MKLIIINVDHLIVYRIIHNLLDHQIPKIFYDHLLEAFRMSHYSKFGNNEFISFVQEPNSDVERLLIAGIQYTYYLNGRIKYEIKASIEYPRLVAKVSDLY